MLNDTTNYDVWLEHSSLKLGYRIAKDENGSHQYSESLAPFAAPQIFQGGYSYDSSDATVNVPLAIEDWSGGCGFTYVPGSPAIAKTMYASSSGIDASWKNRLTLLPEQQTGGSTTQAAIKFVYSAYGTHAMTTRYVYEWTGAAWTSRFDNTNKTNTDLIEYKNSRGTYLVLTLSDDNYYISTDGVTFSQPNSGALYPTFRSVATNKNTSSTSLTIDKPSGVQVDDVLFAAIVTYSTTVSTAPTGWTLIESRTAETPHIYYYYYRVTATEPTSYTWVMSGSSSANTGAIAAYQGCVSTGTPYENATYTVAASGTSPASSSSQTCTGYDRTILTMIAGGVSGGAAGANAFTAAAGYTERADQSDGSALSVVGIFDKVDQDPGAVSSATFTASQSLTIGFTTQYLLKPLAGVSSLNNGMRLAIRGSANGEPLLWCVDSAGGIRNTPDPTHPGLWSNADTIQFSRPFTINGLEVLDNVFYLYTNKGIDSYDGTTIATVWTNTTLTQESTAARPYTWVDQKTYFTYSGSLYRYDGSNIEKLWPRSYQSDSSSRTGNITAITGDERNLYFTIADTTPNYTTMKCDPNVQYTVNNETFMPVFEFTIPSSSATNAMIVLPGASDTLHSTNPHLLAGISTNAHYFILPRNGKSPDSDSNYKFYNATSATLTGCKYDVGAKLFPKYFNSSTVMVQDASTSYNSTVVGTGFLTDGTTLTGSNSISGAGIQTTTFSTDIEFTQLRPDYTLQATNATDVVNLTGVVFNCSLNPPRKRMWTVVVEVDEDIELVGGGDSRHSAKTIRDHLFNGLTKRVTFYDKDNTSFITRVLSAESVVIGTRKSQYKLTLVQLV